MLNSGSVKGFGADSLISFHEAAMVLGIDPEVMTNRMGNADFPERCLARKFRSRAMRLPAILMAPFICFEGPKLTSPFRARIAVMLYDYAEKNWEKIRSDPSFADNLVIDSGYMKLRFGSTFRDAMVALNEKIVILERLTCDPDKMWNAPTVGEQKHCAYEIEEVFNDLGLEETRKRFSGLINEDVEAAVFYASANPKVGGASRKSIASKALKKAAA